MQFVFVQLAISSSKKGLGRSSTVIADWLPTDYLLKIIFLVPLTPLKNTSVPGGDLKPRLMAECPDELHRMPFILQNRTICVSDFREAWSSVRFEPLNDVEHSPFLSFTCLTTASLTQIALPSDVRLQAAYQLDKLSDYRVDYIFQVVVPCCCRLVCSLGLLIVRLLRGFSHHKHTRRMRRGTSKEISSRGSGC